MGLQRSPIKVGNLSIQRDWGYAPAYVEAMWRILQANTAEDFLICSGKVTSLQSLIEMILAKLGLEYETTIQIDQELFRPVDLGISYGDNTKAKHLLGWEYEMDTNHLIDQLITDETRFIEWELKY